MLRLARCTDDVLIRLAAAGDDDAIAVFYRRHEAHVLAYFRRRVNGRGEVAFDLAAETFAQVVASLDRFDPDRGPAIGWMFGIAANVLRTSLHTGRVQQEARDRLAMSVVVITDEDVELIDRLTAESSEARLQGLLAQLPADQREAVLARVVDEDSYTELADRLACSEAVVRQRVARGLRFLRTRSEAIHDHQ